MSTDAYTISTAVTECWTECIRMGLHGTAGVIRWALNNVQDDVETPANAADRLRSIANAVGTPMSIGKRLDRAATLIEAFPFAGYIR